MPRHRHDVGCVLLALFFAVSGLAVGEWPHPNTLRFPDLEFHPPKVDTRVLSNGTRVFLLENHELPTFEMQLWVRVGRQDDPLDKIGLGDLAGEVMRDGGTVSREPDRLNAELERMAASVETWVSEEAAGVKCSCLARDMEKTLDVVADLVLSPAFREEKLRQRRQEAIGEMQRRNDDPARIASREFAAVLYGPKHPGGWRSEPETITAVSRDDLRSWHRRYFVPRDAVLCATGDFDTSTLLQQIESRLGEWRAVSPPAADLPEVTGRTSRRVYLVPKDLTQTHIRIGHLGVRRHCPNRFALIVLNEILGGGSFTSRFVREIRSRRGLAYNVYSYFTEGRDRGVIAAACETKAESTTETISLMLNIMADMTQREVSDSELATAKESILNSFVFRFDSTAKVVLQRLHLHYYGFAEDYLETYVPRLRAVTKADVLEAAKKYLHPDQAVILLVGNPARFDAPVDRFGDVRRIDLRDYSAQPASSPK